MLQQESSVLPLDKNDPDLSNLKTQLLASNSLPSSGLYWNIEMDWRLEGEKASRS